MLAHNLKARSPKGWSGRLCKTHIVGSSTPLDLLTPSLPSTPSPSTRSSSALKLSSSPSSLSLSSSASRTCFATLNFLVSSSTISAACFAPPSCATTVSLCCDWRVLSWRVSFRSAVSASRRRRERDSSSVLREEEMRDRAALSGAMLKFVIVWAMSCDRSQPAALGWKDARWSVTVAGSSSRSMAVVRCICSFSWNGFDCTINQRSDGMIQQGLRQMFSGMQNTAESFLLTLYKIGIAQLQGAFLMWHAPTSSAPQSVLAGGSLLLSEILNSLRATVNINFAHLLHSILFNPKTRPQHRWGRIYLVRST